jgi:hypothetical protein
LFKEIIIIIIIIITASSGDGSGSNSSSNITLVVVLVVVAAAYRCTNISLFSLIILLVLFTPFGFYLRVFVMLFCSFIPCLLQPSKAQW